MSPGRLSRRSLLLTGLTAGCGNWRRASSPFTVFTWAGPWGETFERALKPLFEQATGETVIFDNGWGEEIPKLLIAPPDQPPYDVMIVAPFQVYAVIKQGHFAKLDWSLIPNAKNFHANALDNWVAQEGWGLTWPDASHMGIYGFSAHEAISDWGEVLERRAGFYRASYMSLYTFAAAYAPGRAAEAIEQDFDGVFDFAKRNKSKIAHWWATSPDMAFNLAQGNVDAGNIHSVDAYHLIRDGQQADIFITPDRAHFQAIWLIPKGSRLKTLGHEFLNQFAGLEFQREYAAAGFPTPNPQAAAERATLDPLWRRINPATEEAFRELRYYPYDAYTDNWNAMTDRWNQEVLV